MIKHTEIAREYLEGAAYEILEECDSCGSWHPIDFYGDCRNDDFRMHPDDLVNLWDAAPALLEACKATLQDLEDMTTKEFQHGADRHARIRLKEVIRRATGE